MGLFNWSTNPDLNAVADVGVPAQDGVSTRVFAGLVRALMARIAGFVADTGAITTTGAANAYEVATSSGVTAPPDGYTVKIRLDRTNTDVAFLNVDGTGPKPLLDADGKTFAATRLKAGRVVRAVFDATGQAYRCDVLALVDNTSDQQKATDPTNPIAQALAAKISAGRHAVADANYAAITTDVYIGLTSLTAGRSITLPAASTYPPGQTLYVADESGLCGAALPITLLPAGADTIAGKAAADPAPMQMASPYQKLAFHSNGSNLWTYA